MKYLKRLFNLIIGIPLFTTIVILAALEWLFLPVKYIISYIIYNDTEHDTWFGWAARFVFKLLQKLDLIDQDIKID